MNEAQRSEESGDEGANLTDLLCVADIERELHPTGGTTPAGGKCFVHEQKDICATVYSKTRARVFYNRRNGFEGREQIPCFYDNEKRLDT